MTHRKKVVIKTKRRFGFSISEVGAGGREFNVRRGIFKRGKIRMREAKTRIRKPMIRFKVEFKL